MYYPTTISNLVADVTFKELKDGHFRVVAVGVNPEDDTKYTELGTVTSKPYSRKRRELAVNEVRTKLENSYLELYSGRPASEEDLRAAFAHVKEAVMADHMHLSPRWKHKSTNEAAVVFFERNVLNLILSFADPAKRMFLPSDRDAIEQALVEIAERRNDHDRDKAVEAVRKRLRDADIIYAHMRDQDDRLPELRLSSDAPFTPAPKPEQVKFLPRPVLARFYRLLFKLAEKVPRFVFFCIFVVYGLRPAEAAARKPADIVWHETYCTAEVSSQERNGKLDPKLKNEYSRRVIIISYWGMQLLRRCCDRIGENYPHDENAMNIAVDCAKRVKELLMECGCGEGILTEIEQSVSSDDLDTDDEKDKTHDLKHAKVSCYVLRRVFSTIMRSIMGLSLYETDRLLGHIPVGASGKKNTKLNNVDLNSADTQKAIAAKMERYIFDPSLSLNPACSPYTLSGKTTISLIEFSEYTITNNTKAFQALNLNLSAAETGERISIEMPSGAEHDLTGISTSKNWDGCSRTVIGDTTSKGVTQND